MTYPVWMPKHFCFLYVSYLLIALVWFASIRGDVINFVTICVFLIACHLIKNKAIGRTSSLKLLFRSFSEPSVYLCFLL